MTEEAPVERVRHSPPPSSTHPDAQDFAVSAATRVSRADLFALIDAFDQTQQIADQLREVLRAINHFPHGPQVRRS